MTQHPIWKPSHPETTRMAQFLRFIEHEHQQHLPNYHTLHAWSVAFPALFWESLCTFFNIQFATPPKAILNDYTTMMDAEWFSGARLNFTEHLLSRNDNHPALVCRNESGERHVIDYKTLRTLVYQCRAGLEHLGVQCGDRVVGILPNSAYAIIAMLASASLGAIWSSCSPDFGPTAIVDRLGQLTPTLLFTGNGQQYHGKQHDYRMLANQWSTLIPSLRKVIVCPVIRDYPIQPSITTIQWDDFLHLAEPSNTLYSQPFNHPLCILFSSGTTGKPKCIMHGTGGVLLQHIKELGLHTDLQAHDNLLFYTTCGWMMWNWMVSGLALGATLTLYDGSATYPHAGILFDILEQECVTVFGTSAKFISSVEKAAYYPKEHASLSHLRCILSTGSPLLPQHYDFIYEHVHPNIQLSSISGGTDIVSCFALGNPMEPVYRGELQCIGLGLSVEIYNEKGIAVFEERGELVCTKPFPVMPLRFWNDPENIAYQRAYFNHFPNVWAHGDFAEITQHHGLIIYGRSDATLNPGGVRIGTAEIYRQIEKIPQILESIVIGQEWEDDVRIILFVKLQSGVTLDDTLCKEIRQTIRQHASPRHVPAKILTVDDIPRTINGKIVELAVRQVVHGKPVQNQQSLMNPEALTYFRDRKELME